MRLKDRQFGKKNQKRATKINQRAMQLETTFMGLIHKYERGEDVPTVTDTLGNKYISVYVGDNIVRDASKVFKEYDYNNKTREIYMNLYERMKKRGFVLCQHGGYDHHSRGIFAWCLVEHNNDAPEEDTRQVVEESLSDKLDISIKDAAVRQIIEVLNQGVEEGSKISIEDAMKLLAPTNYYNPDLSKKDDVDVCG